MKSQTTDVSLKNTHAINKKLQCGILNIEQDETLYKVFYSLEDADLVQSTNWYARKDTNTFYVHSDKGVLHRVILDAEKGELVDHKDGNGLNNRRENIRIVTPQQNQHNRGKHKKLSSRFKGVSWSKADQCWRAFIYFNWQQIYIGRFSDEIEAAKAYDAAALKYHKEYARLNFGSKALHFADLHIGSSKHILPHDYLARQIKALHEIKNKIIENKCEFLFICGDTFDRYDATNEEFDAFVRWIVEIDNLGFCTVLVINGNHEQGPGEKTVLDFLGHMKYKFQNVYFYKKPKLLLLKGYAFALVPWNFELEIQAEILYKELLSKKTEFKKFFVLGHLPLPGITTDTGYFIKGSHKMLALDYVDAWFLGDIHARSISPCGRIQMPGSCIQGNWGDKPPKGVSLISLEDPTKPQFIELDVPQFEITKDLARAKTSKNIVKFIGDPKDEDLPENVVETTPYLTEQEVVDYVSDLNVIDGLPEFLAEKGCTKEQQIKAIKLVEKLAGEL
jgi:DNA repair exonuclease SbcCD nuclease subunit